jgi:hypothetical protein
MIVPGSVSFHRWGGVCSPPSQLCAVLFVLPLILIMILIVLFFFTFYFLSLLAFVPISLIAQCSFLSASIPSTSLERHCTCPFPSFIHPFAWFSCSYVRLVLTHPLARIFGFARFWLHNPSHPIISIIRSSIPPFLPVLRETRFIPGLLLASDSGCGGDS